MKKTLLMSLLLIIAFNGYGIPSLKQNDLHQITQQRTKALVKLTVTENNLIAKFQADEKQREEIFNNNLHFLQRIEGFQNVTYNDQLVTVTMDKEIIESNRNTILNNLSRMFYLSGFQIVE